MKKNFNEFQVPKKPGFLKKIMMSPMEIRQHNRSCNIIKQAAENKIAETNGELSMHHFLYVKGCKVVPELKNEYTKYKEDAEYYEYLETVINSCLKNQILTFKEKISRIHNKKEGEKIFFTIIDNELKNHQ